MDDNSPDIGDHSEVEVPVSEDTLEHALANLRALPDTVVLHACLGELLLLLLEPPDARASRQTGEQEEASDGNGETDDSVHDEDPAPTRRGRH